MSARAALVDLLKAEGDFRRFFKACCEASGYTLAAQAWHFREELTMFGQLFRLEEVEDALFTLARELLSASPGAQWDAEWTDQLCKEAMVRIQVSFSDLRATEKDTMSLAYAEHYDRMQDASDANAPPAFRIALKAREREVLLAAARAREGSPINRLLSGET